MDAADATMTTKTATYAAQTARHGHGKGRTAGTMPVWKPRPEASSFAAEMSRADTAKNQVKMGGKQYADVTFNDFVDIVNPLQHIPVVSTIYRDMTGDEIKPPARVMGGALFGGPIGAASAMANVIVEDQTGLDIGENLYAMVNGEDRSLAIARKQGVPTPPPAPQIDVAWLDAPLTGTELAAIDAGDSDILLAKAEPHFAPAGSPADMGIDSGTRLAALARTGGLTDQSAPETARAFAAFGTPVQDIAKPAFAGSRTAGEMPVFSAKTMAIPHRGDLAAQVRLDALPAREPVTRVAFDKL